jgi:hypothetical protein
MVMDDQLEALERDAERFGISLDYSMASLASLETLFDKMAVGLGKEEMDRLIVYFSRYLGEVVCRTYNGKWVLSLDDPRNVYFNTPVIVGHSSVPGLDFSPLGVMRAYSLRRQRGVLYRAIDADVNPSPLDLSDLLEE